MGGFEGGDYGAGGGWIAWAAEKLASRIYKFALRFPRAISEHNPQDAGGLSRDLRGKPRLHRDTLNSLHTLHDPYSAGMRSCRATISHAKMSSD